MRKTQETFAEQLAIGVSSTANSLLLKVTQRSCFSNMKAGRMSRPLLRSLMAYAVPLRRDPLTTPRVHWFQVLSSHILMLANPELRKPHLIHLFQCFYRMKYSGLFSWIAEYLEGHSTWLGNLVTFADSLAEAQEYCLSLPFVENNILFGSPRRLSGKESTCHCRKYRRHGFDSQLKKIPLKRKW